MSGGAAACVTVGRLIARNPSLKILVVESGKHSRDVPNQVEPCRFVEHLADNSTTVTRHKSKPSSFLDGRSAIVPSGHTVGGGSAVNCKQPTPVLASYPTYFTYLTLFLFCSFVAYSHGLRARRQIGLRWLG